MTHIHWVPRQNKLEIPRDKDEVNKWEIHECDGRAHDPDTMVAPLTPKSTLKVQALVREPPTIVSRREEDDTTYIGLMWFPEGLSTKVQGHFWECINGAEKSKEIFFFYRSPFLQFAGSVFLHATYGGAWRIEQQWTRRACAKTNGSHQTRRAAAHQTRHS